MATVTRLMTTEEFLALPDDGVERWLIAGELREAGTMPRRNRLHSVSMAYASAELVNWLRRQPEPRGLVLTGDAGIRMQRDPDTTFGVDVAYVSVEVLAQQTDQTTMIDGISTLAIEILSPSDTVENVNDTLDAYLTAGVPLVWLLDTHHRTVTVYSPGAEPLLFNVRQELTGEPHLPGLRVAVRSLFE